MLDACGGLLNLAGHAAVGTFLTNRLLMGTPEFLPKVALIGGHVISWMLLGLGNSLLVGRRGGLLRAVLWPNTFGRAWTLLFTALGARWVVQEVHRMKNPRPMPPEVMSSSALAVDLRDEMAAAEGSSQGGLRGLFERVNEIHNLEVLTYEVRLPRLPAEFDGFTVVQVSDVHHGPFSKDAFIRRYIDLCVEMDPDLVALTGDYQTYSGDVERAIHLLSPLGEWSQREREGVGAVAIMGNHDREAGTEHVIDALERAHIRVLENANMFLERNGARLYIAGVADPWSPHADLDLALHGIPRGACTILLAHLPDYFVESAGDRVALQLSGHNHGGQIKLPVLGAVLVSSRFGRRYVEGFFKRNGSLMYVSRGLGGKPPIRWGSKPEITVLVLRGDRKT